MAPSAPPQPRKLRDVWLLAGLLTVMAVYPAFRGISHLSEWAGSNNQAVSDCSAGVRGPPPDEHWVKLRSCVIDVRRGFAEASRDGRMQRAYFPVVMTEESALLETHLVLFTSDPDLVRLATVDPASLSEPFRTRDLEGTFRGHSVAEDPLRAEVLLQVSGLAEDFVILRDGFRPSPLRAIVYLGMAMALLTLMLIWVAANKRRRLRFERAQHGAAPVGVEGSSQAPP